MDSEGIKVLYRKKNHSLSLPKQTKKRNKNWQSIYIQFYFFVLGLKNERFTNYTKQWRQNKIRKINKKRREVFA